MYNNLFLNIFLYVYVPIYSLPWILKLKVNNLFLLLLFIVQILKDKTKIFS